MVMRRGRARPRRRRRAVATAIDKPASTTARKPVTFWTSVVVAPYTSVVTPTDSPGRRTSSPVKSALTTGAPASSPDAVVSPRPSTSGQCPSSTISVVLQFSPLGVGGQLNRRTTPPPDSKTRRSPVSKSRSPPADGLRVVANTSRLGAPRSPGSGGGRRHSRFTSSFAACLRDKSSGATAACDGTTETARDGHT